MRRDFLKYCGLAGLGLAMPAWPRWASGEIKNEPYPGPYYVVLNASGDITGTSATRGTYCFAKSAVRRHIILKKGLTAEPGTAARAWLAA